MPDLRSAPSGSWRCAASTGTRGRHTLPAQRRAEFRSASWPRSTGRSGPFPSPALKQAPARVGPALPHAARLAAELSSAALSSGEVPGPARAVGGANVRLTRERRGVRGRPAGPPKAGPGVKLRMRNLRRQPGRPSPSPGRRAKWWPSGPWRSARLSWTPRASAGAAGPPKAARAPGAAPSKRRPAAPPRPRPRPGEVMVRPSRPVVRQSPGMAPGPSAGRMVPAPEGAGPEPGPPPPAAAPAAGVSGAGENGSAAAGPG